MPGSLTSRIRQLGPSLRGLVKNSCAVPKDRECKPTDSSSSWRDSRTSLSSSTMNTVGTSCVLIVPRSCQKLGEGNCDILRFAVAAMGDYVRTWTKNGLSRWLNLLELIEIAGCRSHPPAEIRSRHSDATSCVVHIAYSTTGNE